MSESPADQYEPLVIGLMIAFVFGSLVFILAGEFVRRRMAKDTLRAKDKDSAG